MDDKKTRFNEDAEDNSRGRQEDADDNSKRSWVEQLPSILHNKHVVGGLAISFWSVVLLYYSGLFDYIGVPGISTLSRETYTDEYTFTVDVDDLRKIAENRAIQIKAKAARDLQLNQDHGVRILGLIGRKDVGKTWLLNQMFGTKLRDNMDRSSDEAKDRDGLRILHHQDGKDPWLIVNMLGWMRTARMDVGAVPLMANGQLDEEKRYEALQRNLVDQSLVETLRYMIMEELCQAIIHVVDDIDDRFTYQMANPYLRIANTIQRSIEKSKEPVIMIAHMFKGTEAVDEMKGLVQASRMHIESTRYVQEAVCFDDVLSPYDGSLTQWPEGVACLQPTQIKTFDDVEAFPWKFNAVFETSKEKVVVSNYAFAKEGFPAGKHNDESSARMLTSLKTLVPVKHVKISKVLQESIQSALPLVVDGKVKEGEPFASFGKENLTIDIDDGWVKITSFEKLQCKPTFFEVPDPDSCKGLTSLAMERIGGLQCIKEIEHPTQRNFPILEDTEQELRHNRFVRTLKLRMPNIKMEDVKVVEEDGEYFLEVTERSRKPKNARIRPILDDIHSNQSYLARFYSGTSRMSLSLDGWTIQAHDAMATTMSDGILTIRANQV